VSEPSILIVNSSSFSVNQLAAALAEAGLLSRYVRPYANLNRGWERVAAGLPGLGEAYMRSFGRRVMPEPLGREHITETALLWDFAMAVNVRMPIHAGWWRELRRRLMYRMERTVTWKGARLLCNERMVVASWHCALPAFEKATKLGVIKVLNYPLAHHAFTRRYLLEEAEREPDFAATLNSHDYPSWQVERLDREIELADHILVGSGFAKQSFLAEGVPESKICVIPYGVDASLFTPPESPRPRDRFNVLFAGQLSQRKGISYLLRAYERIHGPGTSLTLVGQLQDDGRALRPWSHLFRHITHVPRPRLAELFRQADVFVFPTLIEGMGLVVVEAMASGLPVITTPNGPGDIVRDGVDGFLVPPRDVDAIEEKLKLLGKSEELRAEMGRNARQRAQEFTWKNYRNRVLGWIRSWQKEEMDPVSLMRSSNG